MPNTIMDCIRSRRSVRKYKDEPVSEEHLQVLLEAAIWAPSGSNQQSWFFTAVQNTGIINDLNALVRTTFLTWDTTDEYLLNTKSKKNAENPNIHFFFHAPLLIIASNEQENRNGMADCAAALQNILLAATSLGLGSCWVNQLRWLREEKTIRQYLAKLGVPKNHLVCGAAVIGHAAHAPKAPDRAPNTRCVVR